MVKYQAEPLDRTFAALADPTRRAIIARLSQEGNLSVSEIARPFAVSLPAVMKHLDALSDAGLIARSKAGRIVSCRLNATPMENAMNWLSHYQRFWSARLDRLAALVEEVSCPPSPPSPSSQASRSNVVSMRRRKRSTPPGRTPKKS